MESMKKKLELVNQFGNPSLSQDVMSYDWHHVGGSTWLWIMANILEELRARLYSIKHIVCIPEAYMLNAISST